jgi:hypothetical protein
LILDLLPNSTEIESCVLSDGGKMTEKEENWIACLLILLDSLGRNLPLQDSKDGGIDLRSMARNLEKNHMAPWNQNDQAHRLEKNILRTRNQSERRRNESWPKIGTKMNAFFDSSPSRRSAMLGSG